MANRFPRRLRAHILVVGLYTLLALVLTWPLVKHLSTHVVGSYTWAFDEYTFVWNSWWFRYALLDLGQNPLTSTHTFYPLGISLVLYTYNLFNAMLSLPLQPFLSLPAISNLTFLFATVLSGYGTFLLARYLLRDMRRTDPRRRSAIPVSDMAAFLAGLVYAFGSFRMIYAAIGHYNLWSTGMIPFFTLYLIRTIREMHWRNAILAGIFLVLALVSDMMLGVFSAMLAIVLLLFALRKHRRAHIAGGWGKLLIRLAAMGLAVLILYSPLLVPILREMFSGYGLAGWGDAQKLSVDLLGFTTPTALHPLGGDWAETLRQTREGTARFRDINTLFLGWTGLGLAIVGAIRNRRRLAAWIWGAVAFALLSLGPLLQINSRSTFTLDGLEIQVPLPFILLHYIPVINANRVPNRFGLVLMLTLAVLIAFGAFWLLGKLRHFRIVSGVVLLLLAGLLIFDHWSVPLPMTDARIPAAFEQVAADPEDFALLQLPLGWRNSFGVQGAESTQAQYYQTYHHKRLLSGNTSRNPPFKFDYFQQISILDSLIALETYGQVDAERRAADRESASQFVQFYDIRYVAVAPGVPGRPPYIDTRPAAIAYVEEVLPVEKVYEAEGWLLYRVETLPAPGATAVDFGSSDTVATMALGEGWAGDEEIQGVSAQWVIAQDARLFLPAVEARTHRLTLTALPFDFPGAVPQEISIKVNGERLDPVSMAPGWKTYAWEVPEQVVRKGLNDVQLGSERLDAPAEVLSDNGAIGLTGQQAPVAIEVNSGGPAGFAYITLGDGDEAVDGSTHHPGYNVAVIQPKSGKVLDRRGFDTTSSGSISEAAALAQFIELVPQGQIVVVALQGDGTVHLTDGALSSLRSIGGGLDPRGLEARSHAIIGVKGAAPGTAMEVSGAESGWLRAAPDRRTLAIAVDSLTWEPAEP